MTDPNAQLPGLPRHVDDTIRSMARLYAEHHQNATQLQHTVNRMTAWAGQPGFVALMTAIVIGWVSLNLLAAAFGYHHNDLPRFPWLADIISLVSLYMVVLILVTQRHADQYTQNRYQLILELVVLSEKKTAKVIQLLEEFRRDSTAIHNRVDQEADDMAQPADPLSVFDAMNQLHTEVEQTKGTSDPA